MAKTVYGQYGAMESERAESDYYRSPIDAVLMLRDNLPEGMVLGPRIVDAGAGDGRLMKPLLHLGHEVVGYDIRDRGDMLSGRIILKDWFDTRSDDLRGVTDIIMNPPYTLADRFIQHALSNMDEGSSVHALLRFTWICAKSRAWARDRLVNMVVCGRLKMLPADGRVEDAGHGGTVDFAWFSFRLVGREPGIIRLTHVSDAR